MTLSADLELWDYRRRVADLYHEMRRHPGDERGSGFPPTVIVMVNRTIVETTGLETS